MPEDGNSHANLSNTNCHVALRHTGFKESVFSSGKLISTIFFEFVGVPSRVREHIPVYQILIVMLYFLVLAFVIKLATYSVIKWILIDCWMNGYGCPISFLAQVQRADFYDQLITIFSYMTRKRRAMKRSFFCSGGKGCEHVKLLPLATCCSQVKIVDRKGSG